MTAQGQEGAGSFLTEDRPLGEEERKSLQAYVAGLTVPLKVELATRGNREARGILSRDASSMVARAVLQSPKLSEEDVLSYVASAQTNEEILRGIAESRQWAANRQIVSALVHNPRTPPPLAVRFLRAFSSNELRILMLNRGISAYVRAEARRLLAQRH